MFVGVCPHGCRCPWSLEKGVGFPGAVVTENGELFDRGAGN